MSLELKFDFCQSGDCLSVEFTEQTGVYNIVSNLGGWGTPNTDISAIVASELIISTPNGSSSTLSIFPQFPDSTTNQIKILTTANLNSLADGIYTITYNVYTLVSSVVTLNATQTKSFLLSCNVKCCVDKLIAKVAESNCGCDSTVIQDALLASSLYQALLLAGGCGKIYQVQSLLARLNRLCTIKHCGCNQTDS